MIPPLLSWLCKKLRYLKERKRSRLKQLNEESLGFWLCKIEMEVGQHLTEGMIAVT